MKKMGDIVVKILRWLMVNAVMPMLVPVLFLAAVDWFKNGSFPFETYLHSLLYNGFYIFSATSLMFSLLEDYQEFKKCVGPIMVTFLVILTMITLGMFYTIQNNNPDYLVTHRFQFIFVWSVSAVYSIFIKFRIAYNKIKFGRR